MAAWIKAGLLVAAMVSVVTGAAVSTPPQSPAPAAILDTDLLQEESHAFAQHSQLSDTRQQFATARQPDQLRDDGTFQPSQDPSLEQGQKVFNAQQGQAFGPKPLQRQNPNLDSQQAVQDVRVTNLDNYRVQAQDQLLEQGQDYEPDTFVSQGVRQSESQGFPQVQAAFSQRPQHQEQNEDQTQVQEQSPVLRQESSTRPESFPGQRSQSRYHGVSSPSGVQTETSQYYRGFQDERDQLNTDDSTPASGRAVSRGSQKYQAEGDYENEQENKQMGSYEYSYDIRAEHTGDMKYHQETRDGDKVIGEYRVKEADGSMRVVKYTADKDNGFQATVEYIMDHDKPEFGRREKPITRGRTHGQQRHRSSSRSSENEPGLRSSFRNQPQSSTGSRRVQFQELGPASRQEDFSKRVPFTSRPGGALSPQLATERDMSVFVASPGRQESSQFHQASTGVNDQSPSITQDSHTFQQGALQDSAYSDEESQGIQQRPASFASRLQSQRLEQTRSPLQQSVLQSQNLNPLTTLSRNDYQASRKNQFNTQTQDSFQSHTRGHIQSQNRQKFQGSIRQDSKNFSPLRGQQRQNFENIRRHQHQIPVRSQPENQNFQFQTQKTQDSHIQGQDRGNLQIQDGYSQTQRGQLLNPDRSQNKVRDEGKFQARDNNFENNDKQPFSIQDRSQFKPQSRDQFQTQRRSHIQTQDRDQFNVQDSPSQAQRIQLQNQDKSKVQIRGKDQDQDSQFQTQDRQQFPTQDVSSFQTQAQKQFPAQDKHTISDQITPQLSTQSKNQYQTNDRQHPGQERQFSSQDRNQFESQFPAQDRQQFSSHDRQQFPAQDRQQFSSQERQQFPAQERQQFSSQGRQQFSSQGRQQFPAQDRQQFPAQDRQHFPAQDRKQFSSQDRQQFPAQDRQQFPAQDRNQFQSQDMQQFSNQNRNQLQTQIRQPFNTQDQEHFPTQDRRQPSSHDGRQFQSLDRKNLQYEDQRQIPTQDSQFQAQYRDQPLTQDRRPFQTQNRNQYQGSSHSYSEERDHAQFQSRGQFQPARRGQFSSQDRDLYLNQRNKLPKPQAQLETHSNPQLNMQRRNEFQRQNNDQYQAQYRDTFQPHSQGQFQSQDENNFQTPITDQFQGSVRRPQLKVQQNDQLAQQGTKLNNQRQFQASSDIQNPNRKAAQLANQEKNDEQLSSNIEHRPYEVNLRQTTDGEELNQEKLGSAYQGQQYRMKDSQNQEFFSSSRRSFAPASAENPNYARTRPVENTKEVKTITHSGNFHTRQEQFSQQHPGLNNAQLSKTTSFQGQQQFPTAENPVVSHQNFNEKLTASSLRGPLALQDDLDEPLSVAPQLQEEEGAQDFQTPSSPVEAQFHGLQKKQDAPLRRPPHAANVVTVPGRSSFQTVAEPHPQP